MEFFIIHVFSNEPSERMCWAASAAALWAALRSAYAQSIPAIADTASAVSRMAPYRILWVPGRLEPWSPRLV